MTYTTPITDRDAADIAAQNSKAFWNVADWVRVYGNSLETNTHLNSEFSTSISFDAISAVVNTDIPTIAEINEFLANIERMRAWVVDNTVFYPAALDTEIKDDYTAGQSETAPSYINVNRWESHIDLMYNLTLDNYYLATQNNDFIVTQGDDYLITQ